MVHEEWTLSTFPAAAIELRGPLPPCPANKAVWGRNDHRLLRVGGPIDSLLPYTLSTPSADEANLYGGARQHRQAPRRWRAAGHTEAACGMDRRSWQGPRLLNMGLEAER